MNNTPERLKITPNKKTIISDKSMKFIKIASIVMGVLIILSLVTLIYGIKQKLSVPAELSSKVEISLSKGEKILSVSADADGGILLWIENSSTTQKKLLIKHINKVGTVVRQFSINTK